MKPVRTDDAPEALGPYSQAIRTGDWVLTSGQIGLIPETGRLAEGFEAQARQVMDNLGAVLAAAGCSFGDVVRATIFVTDMGDFPRLNEIYGAALGEHRPARSTVQVAALPLGARIEIDMMARLPSEPEPSR